MATKRKPRSDRDRWRRPEKELPDGKGYVEAWVQQLSTSGPLIRDDVRYFAETGVWVVGYYAQKQAECLAWRPLRPKTRPAWVKSKGKGE